MPAANGPVTREILHASAKVDGKLARWIVGVFPNETALKAFAAHLKLAYQANVSSTIVEMDKHRPVLKDGQKMEDVKLSKQTVQYNPTAPGLDDDAALA